MHDERLVSLVIPVWQDEAVLARTLARLNAPNDVEVIVASVLGDEWRYRTLRERYPSIRWISAPRGRAVQMNAGAAVSGGRWILFLHADSELPPDWLEVITGLEPRENIAAGAFRFALDSPDWRARLIEAGVRLRVAALGLPYGDQALFVRTHAFKTIGGYRDIPLMEDVDFVRRVRRTGRVFQARSAVVTSARRWEHDGWIRRSLQNVGLSTRFILGAPPARLAQTYFGRKAAAVVMMGRAPWTSGKTRVGVKAGDVAHADLRHALFLDTLDVVTSIARVEHVIACEPAGACEEVRELAGPSVDVIAQHGGDLGQRLANVFDDTFRFGMESVVVIGSDLPDLPARLIREALEALRNRPNRLVLGPAADGGYYLIGMNRPHALFERIEWSTPRVLSQTLASAKARGLDVVLLDTWTDVDDAASLRRILSGTSHPAAARTRAWAIANRAGLFSGDQTPMAISDADVSIGPGATQDRESQLDRLV